MAFGFHNSSESAGLALWVSWGGRRRDRGFTGVIAESHWKLSVRPRFLRFSVRDCKVDDGSPQAYVRDCLIRVRPFICLAFAVPSGTLPGGLPWPPQHSD